MFQHDDSSPFIWLGCFLTVRLTCLTGIDSPRPNRYRKFGIVRRLQSLPTVPLRHR
jgi:hypothetical protein